MLKKFIFNLSLFFAMMPIWVYASDSSLVKVGNNYYDTLEEAIANASSTDVITLISDVELDDTLEISKTVNINLNGNDITAPSKVFLVQGGVLNLSGKGIIKETEPNYGAIMVKGSSVPTDTEYSIVNVSKDVTLEGWSGVFINHDNGKAYGVVVNISGKIKAVNDTDGGNGIGVYVNGNINDQANEPVVNILDGAEITSSGNGIYMAGASTFNIGKAYISGVQSGIGIKSGTLNINGATIECTGKDSTPTEGYNNGINASGSTIQIESNNGYAGDMKIDINSGAFKSKNGNVIYEYIGKGNTSLVESIDVSGGTFISDADKKVIVGSESFNTKHNNFITGGKYSSNPNNYLKAGYTSVSNDGLYNVVKSTMKEIKLNGANNRDEGKGLGSWFVIGIAIVSVILIWFNRKKILDLLVKN